MLRLRNLAHLDAHRRRRLKRPVRRDEFGFRKRRPKIVVAIMLGFGALLATFLRRRKR